MRLLLQDIKRPVCWLLTLIYSARSMLKGSFPIMGHDYIEVFNTLTSQVLACKRCGDRFESSSQPWGYEPFDEPIAEKCEHGFDRPHAWDASSLETAVCPGPKKPDQVGEPG